MKCTVVEYKNELYMIFPSSIKLVSFEQVRDAVYNFKFPTSKKVVGTTQPKRGEILSGEKMLVLNDDNVLEIHNAMFMKKLMSFQIDGFISAEEFANKYGCKLSTVYHFCREDRIPGVMKYNKSWFIPETATYPADRRAGRDMSKRYSKQKGETTEES